MMQTILIGLICLYFISIARSIYLLWKTSINQLWLSIVIQFAILIRGLGLWFFPETNGNFLGQSVISQLSILLVGVVGLAGFQFYERSCLNNMKIQERLKEIENRWQQLVENYPEAVLIAVNYTFVYCNPASVKVFGAESKEQLLGHSIFDTKTNKKREYLLKRLELLKKGQVAPMIERKLVGFDGVEREVNSFSIPVTYQGEEAIQIVIRDVTEQNLNQRKLNHHEKLAAVGQLAAGIAHDFNNALSVISLHSELLMRDEAVNPKDLKRVEIIHRQTKRAASLTSQILDFSRQSVIQLETIELIDFFSNFVELLKSILPERIVVDFLVVSPNTTFIVEADKSRLQQLFMNLAINSRDAMPNGGEISIELKNSAGYFGNDPQHGLNKFVEIVFRDTGSGIPKEIMEHLFEPFYTTKQRGKGTGLGMAQVYGIVSQHDGMIQVNTDESSGTIISICLPKSVKNHVVKGNKKSSLFKQGNRENILIIEDHHDSSHVLLDILNNLNYKTVIANDGEHALATLESSKVEFDLIISDIVMPKISGIEFAKFMIERDSKIPIILVTGHPLTNELENLHLPNIVQILQKPLEIATLSSAIYAALAA
ncbi:MAG: ATP-binding protein [Chloroflexota bacterium]